jgi:DNA-binding transcriptional LysR family regulator
VSSAQLIACASPDYVRRVGRPQSPSDLSRHACLVYTETAAPTKWRLTAEGRDPEIAHVSGPVHSNNPEFVRQLALAGHGVILAPSFSVGGDIAEGRLMALLADWSSQELPIHALYPHRLLLSAKVRGFVEFLAQRFGSQPEWERWRRKPAPPGRTGAIARIGA